MRFHLVVAICLLSLSACSPSTPATPSPSTPATPSASPSGSPAPSASPAAPGTVWTEAELETALSCLEASGDAFAKSSAGSIRYGFENQKRSKSYPTFNQATFDATINTYGDSLVKLKAMGSITGSAADCIKK